ncbi:MAG: glycosyltransferase [Candidatus Tritonobacter lacicola]|nr:glycosyltransferase [Candidatus Tritonobacter lacicola]
MSEYLEGRDIFCFSLTDLDTEMPGNRYQMMTRFARRNRVIFFELPFGFTGPNLSSRLKKSMGGVREVGKNFYAVTTPELPMRSRSGIIDAIDRRMYLGRCARVSSALGVEDRPVLWFYDYRQAFLLEKLRHSLSCYHCTEGYAALATLSTVLRKGWVESRERELASRVDIIFTVSEPLRELMGKLNANTHAILNAADYSLYSRAHRPGERPAELAGLKGPLFGYIGNINVKVDFSVLERLAASHPEGHLVMIGPVGSEARQLSDRLDRRGNVHFLGRKELADLPRYLGHFDICLIPFREIEPARFYQPLKVFEYMASGKPIVSSDLETLKPLASLVYRYRTDAEFDDAIKRALDEEPGEIMRRRIETAKQNTWEKRFEEVNRLMLEELK